MNNFGLHGFEMLFGWLVPIILIVLLMYYLNSDKKDDSSARDILDKRYANGEIDDNEYKKKRDILEK